MFEDSSTALPSSIWTLMNSWFTPTVLFVILNVMIGTIAFTSTIDKQKQQQKSPQNEHQQTKNTPDKSQEPQNLSLLHHRTNTERDNLFNMEHTDQAHYFFQENLVIPRSETHYIFEQTHEQDPQEMQAHFVFEQKESNFDDFQQTHEEKVGETEDEVYSQSTISHFSRARSDTEPASGEVLVKLPARMKKSASLKSPFGHFEEEDMVEARRPATVREKGSAKVTDGDEEVDSKADDFINRFKQQLKLQRVDSIIRYKEGG